ncbi:MAG: hypothetical protein JRI36_07095 [Deltaproteobacteria bacterium]|nr:hypothetical protein [Deltaproteobacteria bacterium]
MTGNLIYQCEACGREVQAQGAEPPALSGCCGAPIKAVEPLSACTTAPSAEHARAADEDDPCDDGRSG